MKLNFIVKKISEMSDKEEGNLNGFYLYNCDLDLYYMEPNYIGNETAAIFLNGRSLKKDSIVAALLFQNEKASKLELEKFNIGKILKISRVDVSKTYRGKGIGTKLFKKFLEYTEKNMPKPFVLKIGKDVFKHTSKKFGFDDFGSRFYFYKLVNSNH